MIILHANMFMYILFMKSDQSHVHTVRVILTSSAINILLPTEEDVFVDKVQYMLPTCFYGSTAKMFSSGNMDSCSV